MRIILVALCGLFFVASPAARAAESFDGCTGVVSALPAVISTSGTWCMEQNLSSASTSAKAITINADGVTLDCNDFVLGGLGGASTKAMGVHADGRSNLTVRHCNIQGFQYGIHLVGTGSGGHDVQDNRVDASTFVGIRVEGDGSVVRDNQILNTGVSPLSTTAYGIYTVGSVDVLDNSVLGVVARAGGNGNAYGIDTNSTAFGSVSNNRVRGLVKDGTGVAFGVINNASGRMAIRGNDLTGDASAGSVAVRCTSNAGRVKDNVIIGFATALAVCGDGGDNDVLP